MFWKHSLQSRWVIYLLFLQPETSARDARRGSLPLGGGGCRVLAVVWLVFGQQRMGDAGLDTSVFVSRAALSQQSLAALN